MKNMLMPSDHEDVLVVFAKPAGDILTEDFPPVQYCKSIICFHVGLSLHTLLNVG